MAQTYEFYRQRADEALAAANGAKLANVRERNLRAEKTWRGLADQARKVADDRAKAKELRRQRIEAEELEAAQSAELPREKAAE